MNDRAVAQKRLNENSFDLEAMCMLNRAQEQVSWGLQQPLGELEGNQGFPFMAAGSPLLFLFGNPAVSQCFKVLTLSFDELLCVYLRPSHSET